MYGGGFDDGTAELDRSLHEQAWVAAGSNAVTTLASLLDSAGCEVNWRNGNNQQLTALAIACQQGNSTCADMLISKGADLNLAMEGGHTPLMIAAAHAWVPSFKETNGMVTAWKNYCNDGSIAATDAYGRVMAADDNVAAGGKVACVRLLLPAGADRHLKCDSRKTALTQAVKAARHTARVASAGFPSQGLHSADGAVKLLVGASPTGSELLELLQQTAFEHLTDALLREGVHDVQALADLLADSRLNATWFDSTLSMSMGEVVSLLHQARELLSLKPGGARAKRAREEFERHAETR